MVKFDQYILLGVPLKLWVMEHMFVLDFGLGDLKGYGAGKIRHRGKKN